MKIYLIGSLRNPRIPKLGKALRALGHEVFDDWHAGGPEADDYWRKYEKTRGRSYRDALEGHAANNVFAFDKRHLKAADAGVLVMPAGKSAHLELGYMLGQGKLGFVLFDKEPARWDLMYKFATEVYFNPAELVEVLDHGHREDARRQGEPIRDVRRASQRDRKHQARHGNGTQLVRPVGRSKGSARDDRAEVRPHSNGRS